MLEIRICVYLVYFFVGTYKKVELKQKIKKYLEKKEVPMEKKNEHC
jgi:hypothetical protein